MESINLFEATGLPALPLGVAKGVSAIVARGRGAYPGEIRGPYTTLSEARSEMDHVVAGDLDDFGHTAAYRFIREFMANGGSKIYVIEPVISATQTIVTTLGTGSQRIFALTGGTTNVAIPGTLHVTVTAADKIEGTDFIVDYSGKRVCFKTAPILSAPIVVTWKEYVASDNVTALASLESMADVTLVSGAYLYLNALSEDIKDHCISCASRARHRIGWISGAYKNTADIITSATGTGQSKYMNFWANRSGYFNDNLLDPSVTWMEFIDPAACILGRGSRENPWKTMHEKTMQNLNQVSEFTTTEITALIAAKVNYFTANQRGGWISKHGYLTDPSGVYPYIDVMRTWIYVGSKSRNDLDAQNLIGEIQITDDQYLRVESVIMNTLRSINREGGIGDPDKLAIAIPGLKPVTSELLDAFKTAESQRSDYQLSLIQTSQQVRKDSVHISYDYLGNLHGLDLYLGGY